MKFLLGSKVNRQVGFEDLIGMFYHPIAPMWYLYVLTIFYLIFSLLDIKKVSFKVVTLCGFIAVTDKMLNMNVDVINQVLYYAYFFVVGGAHSTNKALFGAEKKACICCSCTFGG